MKVAINGCGHGDLDLIYSTIADIEARTKTKVDLLICCGDFQALRNADDLHCFACPPKYRALKDFHKYYSGEKKAPVPTLFVGGNHEAVNHLWELYHGGWVAPNIYYLGAAGVVNFGGLRIGGLSGIYNARHYAAGHFERPPYNASTLRSAYHVRDLEVYRLLKVKERLDVFVSHDWPTHVPHYGDTTWLLKNKPYFRAEVARNELGSPAGWQLLQALQPRHWFAGHLHVAFPAVVPFSKGGQLLQPGDKAAARVTKFLATDKPIPRRKYVQVIDVPVRKPAPLGFSYDPEWLAVLRETHDMMNLGVGPTRFPTPFADAPAAAAEHVDAVAAALKARKGARIPYNFVRTVDVHKRGQGTPPRAIPRNPQTEALLQLLGQPWNLDHGGAGAAPAAGGAGALTADDFLDVDAVPDDDVDPMFAAQPALHNFDPHAISDARGRQDAKRPKLSTLLEGADGGGAGVARPGLAAANPEEIDLGDDDDEGAM